MACYYLLKQEDPMTTPNKRRHPKPRHLAIAILLAAAEATAQSIPTEPSNAHHSQPNRQPLHQPLHQQQRRIQVAPLNTFESVKDEFDSRRGQIENFVFQTWNAFSTNIGEVLFLLR